MNQKKGGGAMFANQRTITIERNYPTKDDKKPFLYAYIDVISQASRNLKGEVAFKLYLYLLSNQHGFSLDYSPQHFVNVYGAHIDSARKAFTQLVDAGYIQDRGNNKYTFTELPVVEQVPLEVKRRVVHLFDREGNRHSKTLSELIAYCNGDVAKAQDAWDYAEKANGGIFYE